jgi:hypothetical protein
MPLNNPGPTMEELVLRGQWGDISLNAAWATAVSGTGVVTQDLRLLRVQSGETAGGTARAHGTIVNNWSMGQPRASLNWSKRFVLRLVCSALGAGADGVARLMMGGKLVSDANGDPANSSIGIRLNNLSLSGLVHNGTNLAVVDLATNVTTNTTFVVDIVSDGNGRVEWFVNEVTKGVSSAGPTGLATSGRASLRVEALNDTHAANQLLDISNIKFFAMQ